MKSSRAHLLLGLPLTAWLAFFLLVPTAIVILYGFLTRGPYGEVVWTFTGANYARAFDPLYLGIIGKSVALAIVTTIVTAVLGFPVAFTMATASRHWRGWLFGLLMLPFLTNFIVRVYAIRVFLGLDGPLNGTLQFLGLLTEPLVLTDSAWSVAIGMITNYLPFMVLPLYVVMERLDFTLLDAARDLGARGSTVLVRVLLPLTKTGFVSGSVLVFVPVLGEFMIPDLLGGARTMLLGNLITEQFLKARDWPFGAALAALLVGAAILTFAAERRFGGRADER